MLEVHKYRSYSPVMDLLVFYHIIRPFTQQSTILHRKLQKIVILFHSQQELQNLSSMGAVFVYLYTSIIAIQIYASPTFLPGSINPFVPVKLLKPIDPDPLFDWTVVPVPDHVLKQYGIFDNPLVNDIANTTPFDMSTTVLICETSIDSPLEPDVQVLVEYLKVEGWNRSCKQITDQMPYCTRLVSHGSASIGLCGPYQYQMRCRDIALEVTSICKLCSRHINDNDRVGGITVNASGLGSIAPLFRGLIVYHNNKLG